MAKQSIDIGVEGNDGTGDSIRESFRKTNENFTELYAVFGLGGTLTFASLSDTPSTFTAGKILGSNATGTAIQELEFASNSALDSAADDTINFDTTSQPGKIVVSVASTDVALDLTPTLGGHLDANDKAIAGVAVTTAAAEALSDLHELVGNNRYDIDDLVITRGYADRRYISSGNAFRVDEEPSGVSQYTYEIEEYTNGYVRITGHGFDSGNNGQQFKFNAEDTDPTGLVTGTVYYIRYITDDTLALFTEANKAFATTEDDQAAEDNKINISGTIADDDTHTITDAGYDSTLAGNFLSDVAMPRKSITRRQGDTMTGALYLHDHPGELAGDGKPNGDEDLQAATKYYVDNTAYSSPEALFVSSKGDDTMKGVPNGKEGTSYTYAYRTINAAAKRAEESIKTAPFELGPYKQTLTHSNGTASEVDTAAIENAQSANTRARDIIDENRDYIIKEVSGYLEFTYPDFTYDVERCELDLELVLKSIALDVNRGNTANALTRIAAERYYSSVSGRKAIGQQLVYTKAAYQLARDLADSVLEQDYYQKKQIAAIERVGDNSAVVSTVTTSTDHGLANKSRVQFVEMDGAGMTEIDDVIVYVKTDGLSSTQFELYTDEDLETPYDNSGFTAFAFSALDPAYIRVRYQDKEEQVIDGAGAATETTQSSVANLFNNVLLTIIEDGIDQGTGQVYGNRYELAIDIGSASYADQTNPDNLDAIPGKVIRGKTSRALGQIIEVENSSGTVTFYMNLLEPTDFVAGEEVEYANIVKTKQVTIFVESGTYEEDYPIKLSRNVSLKGDEFRRVIIRPKRRVSQSKWASTYFFRDKTFDGLTIATGGTPFTNQVGEEQGYFGYHYLLDPAEEKDVGLAVTNPGTYGEKAADILKLNRKFIQEEVIEYVDATYPSLVYNREKCRRDTGIIVDGLVKDLRNGGSEFALENQGEYYSGAVLGQETETEDAINYIDTLAAALIRANTSGLTIRGTVDADVSLGVDADAETVPASGDTPEKKGTVAIVGNLVDVVAYAFDTDYNPPKRNDEMDVFLMDDATIVRNVTVQGHGGFMCVLDPEGQILTKSPYIQTASSFSKSENEKTFAGGMYVDAFVGNLPASVPLTIDPGAGAGGSQSGKVNAFSIWVQSDPGEGLRLRLPQLPAPFYIDGQRYQVNAISDYDSANGWARLYLDATSNNGNGYTFTGADIAKDIFIQTAGNRSILADDFTQINDLGYGLVANNAAFSEQVSTFTYYNQAAMYASNGSEIRALNCSNGYGNFGLVAEGADPNEIPDQVTLKNNMTQPCKAYTDSGNTNAIETAVITAYDFKTPPTNNSIISVDHGGVAGQTQYKISRVTNLSDSNGDGTIGESGDIVVTGVQALNNASITVTTTAGMTGTYTGVATTSSGAGTGATVTVTIDHAGSPNAAVVSLVNVGENYATSETLTVAGTLLGGASPANDLTIDVSTIYGTSAGVRSNIVYKLEIVEDKAVNDDFPPDLDATIALDTIMDYRDSENFVFDDIAETGNLTTRPSTAINFDESDNTTYRSIAFSTNDTFSQPLDEVDDSEILTTFDADFIDVELEADTSNLSGGYGSAAGDTKIAIEQLSDPKVGERLFTDPTVQTLRYPGNSGYTGGMMFSHGGKSYKIKKYSGSTEGNITGATQADPVVITSASHGLTDSDQVTIFNVQGMTEINNKTYYVDVLSTNTYALYNDAGLSDSVDGTGFTAYTNVDTGNGFDGWWADEDSTFWYVEFDDVANTQIVSGGQASGINSAIPAAGKSVFAALREDATAEITIKISLMRATGHDFTQIGTGGFNTSNYPSVLFGDPIGGADAKADFYVDSNDSTKGQVWERRKGRVFFVSSDNDGFFRVGKFFSVDQSTGDITFAGELGISNANSLGFKRGVTINEFSTDETFTDLSGQAVPTEKAIDAYISKRLGYGRTAGQLTGGARIGPGFLALNGLTNMEGNLDMDDNKVENLGNPTAGNDATNKNYVDDNDQAFDQLEDLRNTTITTPTADDLMVATGYKIVITDPETGTNAPFQVGDTVEGSTTGATGTIIDRIAFTDEIYGSVTKLVIDQSGATVFDENDDIDGTTAGRLNVTANVREANIDEFANATVKKSGTPGDVTYSDIDITVERSSTDQLVNLQLIAGSIINADVKSTAGIEQSKTLMNRAEVVSDSSGMYGADSSNAGQNDRGLAAFNDDSFAADYRLTLSGNISALAGDVIIQGTNRGFVTATVSNSTTVVVRSPDLFTIAGTNVTKATITGGVEGSASSLAVTVTGVERTGFISLADRSIPYGKFQNLVGSTGGQSNPTNQGGSVIGRSSNGTGIAEAVTFATVVDQGLGLADGDFSGSAIGDVADDGEALTKTGTGQYGITDIATNSANNSIAKRDGNGKLQATSYIIGGDTSYEILSEDAGALTFKTPGQGVILEASGASKPVIKTGGVVEVGDVPAYSESTLHANSSFGSGEDDEEVSEVKARWTTTSFVESVAGGTGIGLGDGLGFATEQDANNILFVSNENVEARVTTTGIETDDLRSLTANTDLTISANGTGIVKVNDTLAVNVIESYTTNGDLTIRGNGTGNTIVDDTLKVDSITSKSTNTNLVLSGNGTGVVEINDSATLKGTFSPDSTANNRDLGTSSSTFQTIYARNLNAGSNSTAGTITGDWTLTAGSTLEATYADLAEDYEADAQYAVGIVLVFGGDKEVTHSTEHNTTRVAGVLSGAPAYTMNAGCPGIKACVALQGRVPVNVIGRVAKGDMLVASSIPGYAIVNNNPNVGTVIGKAVGTKDTTERGQVEVVVGRL